MANISQRNSNFLYFISYLQIIGIILVVFGHSMHEYNDAFGMDLTVYRMMYSFRMPLFLFVSGFLLVYTSVRSDKYTSVGAFALKKFKRLLIPFIFISALVFVPRTMMSGVADDVVTLSFASFFDAFLFSDSFMIPYYWFLYTSFTLLIVTYAAISFAHKSKVCHIPSALVALFVLFVILRIIFSEQYTDFLSLSNTIARGAFFVAGAIYCYYYDAVEQRFGQILASPIFAIACCIIWALLFQISEGNELMLVCSFFGIFMCVSLAKFIVAAHITVLDHLKGASYMIFLLSWFFNIASQQLLAHFTDFPWWVYAALSLTTGVYGPWLIYRCLKKYNKHRFSQIISFLLGQNTSVSKI